MLKQNKITWLRFAALSLVMLTLTTLGVVLHDHGSAQAAGELTITFPQRSIGLHPTTATRTIRDQADTGLQSGGDFTIPYIQTETTFTPEVTVDSGSVPVDGGIKFVLNEGQGNERVLYDMSGTGPYSVSFEALDRGTYTLDTYVVNGSNVVQVGAGKHDTMTGIGIGDIIAVIGDSTTAGLPYDLDPVYNWTQAGVGELSDDNRNFAQQDPNDGLYYLSFTKELNNTLSQNYGYPVFIMNEGIGAIETGGYSQYMQNSNDFQSRMTSLKPTKWVIHLGINDVRGDNLAPGYIAGVESMVDEIIASYDARPADILIAKPMFIQEDQVHSDIQATYATAIDALVAERGLSLGPDYYHDFAERYNDFYSATYHPNQAGYQEMGRLLGLSLAAPANVQGIQDGTDFTISWDDLSLQHPEVAGYRIKYGTEPGVYSQTVDVGDVTQGTISVEQGQIYYYTVEAYYSGVSANYNGDPYTIVANSTEAHEQQLFVDGVPSKPLNVVAEVGVQYATISFDPPASDGARVITSYTVTSIPDGITETGTGSPIVIDGLTSGVEYTFTVRATNSAGDSPESDASNAVTPPITTDLSVDLSLDNPEDVLPGNTVSFTARITNEGVDDLDLSAFNDSVMSPLLSVFVPANDLVFTGVTADNASCEPGDLIADSPYAAYFPNHTDYSTIGCIFTGDTTILQTGESYVMRFDFEVLETVGDSFSMYAMNTNVTRDPDMPEINGVYMGGPDFLDGFLATNINNVASYTYPQVPFVDANGDSIDDNAQPYVGSFTNDVTGKLVAIDLTSDCSLTESSLQQEADLGTQDAAYAYPNGLVGFSAACTSSEITVTHYYYDVTGEWVLRKHNPGASSFFDVSDASYDQITIDGHSVLRVRYVVEDNGVLDLDPADGVITDPVGLGLLQVAAPATGVKHK